MKKIRFNTFETNSSSTHSLTICTKEEYNKWKDGELIFDNYKDKLISRDKKESEDDYRYKTFEGWLDDDYSETFVQNYTTPNGEEIIAFGKYGSDY